MKDRSITATTAPGRRPRPLAIFVLATLSLLAAASSSCILAEIRDRYAVEVVVDGQEWNEASLDALAVALDLLPEHIVTRLGNRHYGRLQVLSNPEGMDLDGWQPYSDGANFYSNYGERNQIVLVPNQSARTALHELGHAYQMREVPSNRYAWVFFQTEMREFMAATDWELVSSDQEIAEARSVAELRFSYEGPQIWQRLSNEDPSEDYANSFALFFYAPDDLQELSPVRYQFMRDHVASDAR